MKDLSKHDHLAVREISSSASLQKRESEQRACVHVVFVSISENSAPKSFVSIYIYIHTYIYKVYKYGK